MRFERSPHVLLKTFGDIRIKITQSVHVDVILDGIRNNLELLVVDKCVQGVDVLIGQNFTELLRH